MAWEARDYHQNGIAAENSLVRHSKDFKEAVGKLKEKKWSKEPLAIGYGSILWHSVSITSARAKALHLHNNNNGLLSEYQHSTS